MSCKILSKDKITDIEFLDLMIKHHNVAIKMSQLIMMTSVDDFIIDFARKIIYNQTNDINLMEKLHKSIPNMQNVKSCNCSHSVISGHLENSYPNIFSNLKCHDSHFKHFEQTPLQLQIQEEKTFEIINHQESETNDNDDTSNHKISDEEYVAHMLEHHKSGIDLAKLAVKSTKEPKILMIAQNMILEQEKELFTIKNLYGCLKNGWRQQH